MTALNILPENLEKFRSTKLYGAPLKWLTIFLYPSFTSRTVMKSCRLGASTRFGWRKVWNGVKCNFPSAHHHVRNVVRKLSMSRVRMWNFTRIGSKTKKLWLSIVPVQRPSEQPGLGPPFKGVNCNFSWPEFDKPYGVRKLSISDA